MDLTSVPFMVFDRPRYVVGDDLIERNIEFLKGIRPEYFQLICKHHLSLMQQPDSEGPVPKVYLATSVRLLYGQALEAFLAMLFALFQAPFCFPAWLQSYRPEDLRRLVELINNNVQDFEYFKLLPKRKDWAAIAELICVFPDDLPGQKEIIQGYSGLWKMLAADFLNEKRTKEYNSLKHGFRVAQGGFRLSIGKQYSPEVRVESMSLLGHSPYGCTTFFMNKMENSIKDTIVFSLRRTSFNWDPAYLAARIELISHSIQNIASYAIGINCGNFSDQLFHYPDDLMIFNTASYPKVGVTDFDFDHSYSGVGPLSMDDTQIRQYYAEKIVVRERRQGDSATPSESP